jgi:hypothetical protein
MGNKGKNDHQAQTGPDSKSMLQDSKLMQASSFMETWRAFMANPSQAKSLGMSHGHVNVDSAGKSEANEVAFRPVSTEQGAYALYLRQSDGNGAVAHAAKAYTNSLPALIRASIDYLSKAQRFREIDMREALQASAPTIVEMVPEWFKDGKRYDIIRASAFDWTPEERSQINQQIMKGLIGEIEGVILKSQTDGAYCKRSGGMERDTSFISEALSSTKLSKEERAQFKLLVREAIAHSLSYRNAVGVSCALKLESACGINGLEFIGASWSALRQPQTMQKSD